MPKKEKTMENFTKFTNKLNSFYDIELPFHISSLYNKIYKACPMSNYRIKALLMKIYYSEIDKHNDIKRN